jgi:hypothetical protein
VPSSVNTIARPIEIVVSSPPATKKTRTRVGRSSRNATTTTRINVGQNADAIASRRISGQSDTTRRRAYAWDAARTGG